MDEKSLKDDEIKEMATIYRKETTRELSKYHKAMNAAAQELCIANPGLLRQRSVMIEKACAHIIEQGFQFAKGK